MKAVSAMPTVCEQIKSDFSVSLDSEADHLKTSLRFGLIGPSLKILKDGVK